MQNDSNNSPRVDLISDNSELITKEQLAKLTGYSIATIMRLKKRKQIPFIQPGGPGTLLRFPRDCVRLLQDGWANSQVTADQRSNPSELTTVSSALSPAQTQGTALPSLTSEIAQPTPKQTRRFGPLPRWQTTDSRFRSKE